MKKKNNLPRRALFAALVIAAFLGIFLSHQARAQKRNYSDFHCYYLAGERFLQKQNIYVIKDTQAAEFRYAPVFAMLVSGFALLPERAADSLWLALNFLLLVISFLLLGKLARLDGLGNRKRWLIYGLTLALVARFILNTLDSGQVNILIFWAIIYGVYFISLRKNSAGAALIAFACLIKYTPLLFIPYFLIRKKPKTALLVILFIALYLLLPALSVGLKTNFAYLKGLIPQLTSSTILEPMTILDPKNQSLYSAIQRIFTNCIMYFYAPVMPFQNLHLSPPAIKSIYLALCAMLLAAIAFLPKKLSRQKINQQILNIDYAMLLICIVLFNLNAWMHNYMLLAFGYFIILKFIANNGRKAWGMILLLLISFALNLITLKSITNKTLAYKLHFYSPMALSALIVFVGLLKIKFNEQKEISG